MAINRIDYDGNTLIDLSSDTLASASSLAYGVTAHDRTGAQITGSLEFVTYYTGSSTPSAGTGSDGDIYLKVVS